MKKIKSYPFCLLCFLLCFCPSLYAQKTIQKGAEGMELIKIATLYNGIPYLTYQIHYSYSDSVAPNTILDSTYINCHLSVGKSFISDSETEVLNDGQNFVYVDNIDSTITVSPAQPQPVMQLPLLDSIFKAVNVSGMTVANTGDSVRTLTIGFTPWSVYHGYQIVYNPYNYLIRQIQYYTASNGAYNLPADHILTTTITMTGNNISPIDPSTFNINRYVYSLNGQYYPQPAYQQYQITANQ